MLTFVVRRLITAIALFVVLTYGIWLLTTTDGYQTWHHLTWSDALPVSYVLWLARILHGDFGFSVRTRQPILAILQTHLLPSILLIVPAYILQQILAFVVGVQAGVRVHSWFDRIMSRLMFLIVAFPPFWFALLAGMLLGGGGIGLALFPPSSLVNLHLIGAEFGTPEYWAFFHNHPWTLIYDLVRHLELPILVLAIVGAASDGQFVRIAMHDAMRAEHIRAARARGLSERAVRWRHALRNALLPIITNLGIQLPRLVFTAALVEFVFDIPGLGRLFTSAIYTPPATSLTSDLGRSLAVDNNIVTAYLLILGAVSLLGSVVADLGYAAADPRIRLGGTGQSFAVNPFRSTRPIFQVGPLQAQLGQALMAALVVVVLLIGGFTAYRIHSIGSDVDGEYAGMVLPNPNPSFTAAIYGYVAIHTAPNGTIKGSATICEVIPYYQKQPTYIGYALSGETDHVSSVTLQWFSPTGDGFDMNGALPDRGKPLNMSGTDQNNFGGTQAVKIQFVPTTFDAFKQRCQDDQTARGQQ